MLPTRRIACTFVALVACDSGKAPSPTTPPKPTVEVPADAVPVAPAIDAAADDPTLVRVKQPVPPGPYVIQYNCFHSDMPFGNGSQRRDITYDLGKRELTTVEEIVKDTGTPGKPPPIRADDKTPPPPKPKLTKLSDAWVQKLSAAVDAVLKGGPYHPEWPVPEGTPCTLTILAGTTTVFAIDKAYTKEQDAVTALVAAFAAP